MDWTLYPADRNWATRWLGDRLVIVWQFDTYGDAVDQPSQRVSGVVVELQFVRIRQIRTHAGLVPVAGHATLRPIAETSGSWTRHFQLEESAADRGAGTITYEFSYESVPDGIQAGPLHGYAPSLEGSDEEPERD